MCSKRTVDDDNENDHKGYPFRVPPPLSSDKQAAHVRRPSELPDNGLCRS